MCSPLSPFYVWGLMEVLAQTKIIQVGTPLNQIRNGRTRNQSIVSIHLVDRRKDDSWVQQRASLGSLLSCGSIWQVSSGEFLVTMWGVVGAIYPRTFILLPRTYSCLPVYPSYAYWVLGGPKCTNVWYDLEAKSLADLCVQRTVLCCI